MKKFIFLIALVSIVGSLSAQNETINNARIIGSYEIGNNEVTTVLDEVTGCIRKTSPHTKGLFLPNESVQVRISTTGEMAEIIKPSLPEQVYANKQCSNNNSNDGILDALKMTSSNKDIMINCSGSCDCGMEGVLGGNGDYLRCKCTECTMTITFTRSLAAASNGNPSPNTPNNETSVFNLKDTKMSVPLIKEFLEYSNNASIKSVELHKRGQNFSITYTYLDSDGNDETVTYARTGNKTYQITCTGSCGCLEVYHFDTNTASCSCDPCIMNVTEVKEKE